MRVDYIIYTQGHIVPRFCLSSQRSSSSIRGWARCCMIGHFSSSGLLTLMFLLMEYFFLDCLQKDKFKLCMNLHYPSSPEVWWSSQAHPNIQDQFMAGWCHFGKLEIFSCHELVWSKFDSSVSAKAASDHQLLTLNHTYSLHHEILTICWVMPSFTRITFFAMCCITGRSLSV